MKYWADIGNTTSAEPWWWSARDGSNNAMEVSKASDPRGEMDLIALRCLGPPRPPDGTPSKALAAAAAAAADTEGGEEGRDKPPDRLADGDRYCEFDTPMAAKPRRGTG